MLVGIGYVGYDHDLLFPRPFLTFAFCRVLADSPLIPLPGERWHQIDCLFLHLRFCYTLVWFGSLGLLFTLSKILPLIPQLAHLLHLRMVYRVFDAFMSYGDAKIGLYTMNKLYIDIPSSLPVV